MTSSTITRATKEEASAKQTFPSSEKDARERSSIGRWLLAAFLAVVAALLLLEAGARFVVFCCKPASSPNPQYDSKFRVANSLSSLDDNVLFCGDSLMKEGVYPELITSKLKKSNAHIRCVNLAVTGGTQKDAVQFLDYIDKKGIRPKLLVFDYEVSNTCLPIEANNIEWGQAHSYLFRGQLSRPKNCKEAAQIVPSDFSYLMRQRANLKRTISEFFSVVQSPKVFEQKSFYDPKDAPEFEVSRAGMAPNNRIEDTLDWQDEHRKIGFFTPFCPQSALYKFNPDAYSIITSYCQKHQIPLLMVWLPHQSKVYNAYYYKAPYTASWQRLQFEKLSKQPLVSAEFLNVLPDDSIYFHDYRHLNTYGCVKASELLAETLAKPKYQQILARKSQ